MMRASPWDPSAERGRVVDWDAHRGNHLGQRLNKPHQQAGHMGASDPIKPHKALAPRGPSTYGSLLPQGRRRASGAFKHKKLSAPSNHLLGDHHVVDVHVGGEAPFVGEWTIDDAALL